MPVRNFPRNTPRLDHKPLQLRTMRPTSETLPREVCGGRLQARLPEAGRSFRHEGDVGSTLLKASAPAMPPLPMPPLPSAPEWQSPLSMPPLPDLPPEALFEPRTTSSFGLGVNALAEHAKAARASFAAKNAWVQARAEAKERSRLYRREDQSFRDESGAGATRSVPVRVRPTRAESLSTAHAQFGRDAIQVVRQIGRALRRLSGVPRRYGSAFDGPGSSGVVRTEIHSNVRSVGASTGSGAMTGARTGIDLDKTFDPGMAAHGIGEASRDLALAGVGLSMFDAASAVDGIVTLESGRSKAKQTLHRTVHDAGLFLKFVDRATAKEAEAYLDFQNASEKIIAPSAEERATQATTVAVALRGAVVQPTATAIGAGIQLASFAVDTTGAGIGLVPLSLVAVGLDFH